MELNRKITGSSDLNQLANELTYRRYVANRVSLGRYFKIISIPEYIVLCIAEGKERKDGGEPGKVYLADIANRMKLPIRQASSLIGGLRDGGLVTWSHDGDGRDGTYIRITELGSRKAAEQGKILSDYYGNVVKKFGKDNIVLFLQLLNELDSIMDEELGPLESGETDGN